jgi:hypothetical protein
MEAALSPGRFALATLVTLLVLLPLLIAIVAFCRWVLVLIALVTFCRWVLGMRWSTLITLLVLLPMFCYVAASWGWVQGVGLTVARAVSGRRTRPPTAAGNAAGADPPDPAQPALACEERA